MNSIGIMQGRLTNPKIRNREGIQFQLYNLDDMEDEHENAKLLGLGGIEWVIADKVSNLFLGKFSDQIIIKDLVKKSPINSICLDYLMDLDLKNKDLGFATDTINWIANIASNIGCKTMVIPIYNINMQMGQIRYLISLILEWFNIKIAFEFLDSNSFTGINFINDLLYVDKLNFRDNNKIGCCFDIGNNCLMLGNAVTPTQKNHEGIIKEMENYYRHNKLYHIHIKEKNKHGDTIPLGTGIIGKKGWKEIFSFLKDINYSGDYTLQVARGENGKELETVKNQIEFIKELI